jgi:hypothetical protein
LHLVQASAVGTKPLAAILEDALWSGSNAHAIGAVAGLQHGSAF